MIVHWWLPGVAPCGAQLGEEFTGEPSEVTCFTCRGYVDRRLADSKRGFMSTTAEDIARVTHEANRAWQVVTGDPAPSPHWDEAPQWQQDSAIEGVRNALAGNTPQQSHDGWLNHKIATGWTYGPVKDEAAKTHPCMVPYNLLPPEQKIKDHLFVAIVQTLGGQADG